MKIIKSSEYEPQAYDRGVGLWIFRRCAPGSEAPDNLEYLAVSRGKFVDCSSGVCYTLCSGGVIIKSSVQRNGKVEKINKEAWLCSSEGESRYSNPLKELIASTNKLVNLTGCSVQSS